MNLSLLTITKGEQFALSFLMATNALAARLEAEHVIMADGPDALFALQSLKWYVAPSLYEVRSQGYLESVHELGVNACTRDYVLRLDDDELCSQSMQEWLARGDYKAEDHWKFSRAHLWKSSDRVLLTPQLWPDHQTRMSIRAKAGGRFGIHSGSPYGGGAVAPCVIEHHKFLVKNADERWAIAHRYDSIVPGSGTGGMIAFQVPEHAYAGQKVWFSDLGIGLDAEIRVRAREGVL